MRATRLRYGGPGEAISDLVLLSLGNARLLLHPPILATALGGAALAGLLAAVVARRAA